MARKPEIQYKDIFPSKKRLVEIEVYQVPESSCECGYSYSFQYCNYQTGVTLLRYDNSGHYKEHPDNHHKHIKETVKHVNYPDDIYEHLQNFAQEVRSRYGQQIL